MTKEQLEKAKSAIAELSAAMPGLVDETTKMAKEMKEAGLTDTEMCLIHTAYVMFSIKQAEALMQAAQMQGRA